MGIGFVAHFRLPGHNWRGSQRTLMITLASVFLGGTSVFGGTGTILGTFVACFIIGSIEAGIVAIGLTGFWTKLIYGLTIVLSVSMHTILKRRMGK
jgi:simple sugar transport system permease protein